MNTNPLTIVKIEGPYREPREPVFSYDYAIQRANWSTPYGVRVKVSVPEELDYLKDKVLGLSGGTPGQQLMITRDLAKHIADCKLRIADEADMLSQRLDVLIEPFTGALGHLFPKLEAWMKESQTTLREEIRQKVGV